MKIFCLYIFILLGACRTAETFDVVEKSRPIKPVWIHHASEPVLSEDGSLIIYVSKLTSDEGNLDDVKSRSEKNAKANMSAKFLEQIANDSFLENDQKLFNELAQKHFETNFSSYLSLNDVYYEKILATTGPVFHFFLKYNVETSKMDGLVASFGKSLIQSKLSKSLTSHGRQLAYKYQGFKVLGH